MYFQSKTSKKDFKKINSKFNQKLELKKILNLDLFERYFLRFRIITTNIIPITATIPITI
jgi:hypothetical protein